MSSEESKKTLKAVSQARQAGGGRTNRLSTLAQSDYLAPEKRNAIADILWGSEVTRLDTWVKMLIFAETITIAVMWTVIIILLLT